MYILECGFAHATMHAGEERLGDCIASSHGSSHEVVEFYVLYLRNGQVRLADLNGHSLISLVRCLLLSLFSKIF